MTYYLRSLYFRIRLLFILKPNPAVMIGKYYAKILRILSENALEIRCEENILRILFDSIASRQMIDDYQASREYRVESSTKLGAEFCDQAGIIPDA